jgi:HEAT repeat protein
VSRRRLAFVLLIGLVGCGDSDPADESPAAATHAPVVATAIAELQQLAPPRLLPPPAPYELVDGLVQFLANSDARSRDLPLEEVRGIGDAALPSLVTIAIDMERSASERSAAIELLAAIGTDAAGLRLVALCDSTNEPWIRSHAAWRLSELDPAVDVVIPGLLLRLRSESDHEAAVYVAVALASRGNFAGLEMLSRIAATDADENVRSRAAAQLATVVEHAGATDAATLIDQWHGRTPGLEVREPSTRLRLAAWTWIQTLSGDTFQLRPVDDGRFLLMRLGPWIVEPLAASLKDVDPYVRLHSAQCLERMGVVARPAVPALIDALDDPRVAPQAAMSLGAIGGPDVRAALLGAVESGGHELRVASARGLGVLGDPLALPAFGAALIDESNPLDLRQAVAESILRIDSDDPRPLTLLVECLTNPAADVGGAERALQSWIDERVESPLISELLSAWNDADQRAGAIPTSSEASARRAARALAWRAWLSD